MWLSKALTVGLLALAGCGFTPAYGPQGGGSVLQNSILAEEPRDKPAFDFVERIEERLGPSDAPRFALNYSIAVAAVNMGITAANATTRINLTGSVTWQLMDVATGAQLTAGRAQNFTSYSVVGSTVASLSAQEDAAVRLVRILADQIVSQLLATSGQWVP
ncbi:LPS-assembly lipoprotein [Pseudorhodobacter antarcticus]|jgi:LPS-assembly lipoprotein|uniref:LPS-assembly lipoprotein n=1 Tax=Pseudorhodobacter antarcticus TaxID=1077947 RepID=A0A1H8ITG5_9RHOB|nr:LPS assembly lipoprotein LptE [Pseudorhodobacter antarcticus]SEN71297.1 LPS-assembly lipoprotein [Pseudorhodobacter antarcticus]